MTDATTTTKEPAIKPEELSDILKKFEDDMMKEEDLKKGKNIFKDTMRFNNIDKSLNQEVVDVPKLRNAFILKVANKVNENNFPFRLKLEDGGKVTISPLERELLELEMFIGIRPSNSYEAWMIENMKDRYNVLMEQKATISGKK